jgi:glyoxylase-like metal-dependent hydrolase (beta-lactamase superfamily II)
VSARVDVLTTGYVGERVASTVVLVRENDVVLVIDPGMVADRRRILDPLAALGVHPLDVTDVVVSHHHPDHTLNVALFERATVRDYWATYRDDVWGDRDDAVPGAPSIRLMDTPGHTPQDVSTLVTTDEGLVVCTHLWWSAAGPLVDPLADDQAQLEASRAKVLALNPVTIIPGHGAAFSPNDRPL